MPQIKLSTADWQQKKTQPQGTVTALVSSKTAISVYGALLGALATIGSQSALQNTTVEKTIEPPRKASPILDKPKESPKETPKVEIKQSAYEGAVRYAWSVESDPKKPDQLKRLIFLYRSTSLEASNKWSSREGFYDLFKSEETKLGLKNQLKLTRYVVGQEWTRQIPETPPITITDPLAVRVTQFFSETISILERIDAGK